MINISRTLMLLCFINPVVTWADGWMVESDRVDLGGRIPSQHEISGSTLMMLTSDPVDYSSELEVYEKEPDGWVMAQTIERPVNASNFAYHKSISGDRALIVHSDNPISNPDTGQSESIGVYRRGASSWELEGYLPLENDTYHIVRSLDLDGNQAAVSLWREPVEINENGVALYREVVEIWKLEGGNWTQTATVSSPDTQNMLVREEQLEFGFDIDLVGDMLAVSTIPYRLNSTGDSNGSVYLFERKLLEDADVPTWELARRLTQDTSRGNVTFGQQVDLTPNRLLITATDFKETNSNAEFSPTAYGAYLYTKDADSNWVDDGVIKGLDPDLTQYIADVTGLDPDVVFFEFNFDGAVLLDNAPVVWTPEFGIELEKTSAGWQPVRLFRRSNRVSTFNVLSFSEIRSGNGSIVFTGRRSYNPDTGSPPALIVFETECASEKPLEPLQWTTISPPCLSLDNPLTVSDVFADDFGDAVYGNDWVMFRFDLELYDYRQMELGDVLEPGDGYWIISATDQTIMLDLPAGAAPTQVNLTTDDVACVDTALGCLAANLPDFPDPRVGFRMAGNPLNAVVPIGDIRIRYEEGACAGGCDLDEANDAERVQNTLYRYRGGPTYDFLTTADQLLPWDGVFLGTYLDASGLETEIVFPLVVEQ